MVKVMDVSFDPDCNPFETVALDCPNNAFRVRKTVLYVNCATKFKRELPYITLNSFSQMKQMLMVLRGAYIHSVVPTTWTCDPLFYGSNDGCDCACGAWDPDCDTTSQKVFNCDTTNDQVRRTMSRNNPSEPVCLFVCSHGRLRCC